MSQTELVLQPVASGLQPPCIDSMVWVPFSWFNKASADAIVKRLTIRPRTFGKEPREPIETFIKHFDSKMFGMPYRFGMDYLNARGYVPGPECFHLAQGHPIHARKFPDPFHPNASPNQNVFFEDMLWATACLRCFLAKAPTRSGKTPTALNTIGKLGVTAIVIVTTKFLAHQWVDRTMEHIGFTRDEIGLVEEGKADWEGKSVVISVIHNLIDIKWPDEFYWYFGTAVWDEVHRIGARQFSRSIKQFKAKVKFGMTATDRRKDGCQKIFLDYFGEAAVIAQSEAMHCICHVLAYRRRGGPYDNKIPLAVLQNLVAKDVERNELIAFTAHTLYQVGRNIIILSDRVEQLQTLQKMVCNLGIPPEATGLFTRTYTDEAGKEKVFKQNDLDLVIANATVIFATYGMAKDAIDIPRLDAGIDATPRAEGTQAIGRIRTPLEGKREPVWFTVRDVGVRILEKQTDARLRDYRESNVKVIDHGQTKT